MLHKYKQNIQNKLKNIPTKIHEETKGGSFSIGGLFTITVFRPPGHFSTRVNIISDKSHQLYIRQQGILSENRNNEDICDVLSLSDQLNTS